MIVNQTYLQAIQNQFNQVIQYVQGIEDINTDQLFADWYENKEVFISTFEGLIYEYPKQVTFKLPPDQKQEYYEDMVTKLYLQMVGSCDGPDYDLNKSFYEWFTSCVTAESFFGNKTVKTFSSAHIKIPAGAKVLKSFKYFMTNENLLREFQDECSMILQQDKLKGALCLSVHPLDFLSLSENACNWNTCHALDKDFAAGNLSLMIDPSTFIVYLKSGVDQKITNFPISVPWNNKKWRVLGFLSQDFKMMFLSKQYPYTFNEILEKELEDALLDSGLIDKYWTHWTTEHYESHNPEFITQAMIPRGFNKMSPPRDFLKMHDYALNFNDVLFSSDYRNPYWRARYNDVYLLEVDNENSFFEIGKPVKCLKCGKNYILDSEIMICRDCFGLKPKNNQRRVLDWQKDKKQKIE